MTVDVVFEPDGPLSEAELHEIATAFRMAIEETVRAGVLREMSSFPRGCCSFASNLLQRYLCERGIYTWYISGEYGKGWDVESHAWLETQDRLVIDITGDQYRYNHDLHFEQAVYIGPRTDGFHNRFALSEPVPYSRSNDPFGPDRKMEKRYEAVLERMNHIR